jgi:hypothetical protein
MRKGEKLARCILVSHRLGWELGLMPASVTNRKLG